MVLKFYDFINEVRRDLQFSYLKKLMTDLGYDYAFTNPDHKFYKTVIDRDGNPHRLLLVTQILTGCCLLLISITLVVQLMPLLSPK